MPFSVNRNGIRMDTEKWTRQLDEITEDFREEFGDLTEEQLNWKPKSGIWSVAQNIDHLIVINGTYVPVIEAIRNQTYRTPLMGKLPFMTRFFGKLILNSVQPDRRRKIKTFPIWEPAPGPIGGDILERFVQQQNLLRHLMENSRDLIDRGTIVSSPANRNIVYPLETAFDIILTHERRHFEQAKEVLPIERGF